MPGRALRTRAVTFGNALFRNDTPGWGEVRNET
jgi:hypothetical protein